MPLRVLVLNREEESAAVIGAHFEARGDQVWWSTEPEKIVELSAESNPDLTVLDLHFADDVRNRILGTLDRLAERSRVIFTTDFPDPVRESEAHYHGEAVFWPRPFTRGSLEVAVAALQDDAPAPSALAEGLPRLRLPLVLKTTLPLLLILAALTAALLLLASQIVINPLEVYLRERLALTGQATAGQFTAVEARLLADTRRIQFTEGIGAALAAQDAETLRRLALPLAVNNDLGAIEFIDSRGLGVLSLRRDANSPGTYQPSRGDTIYRDWPFVRQVLEGEQDDIGDKYAGLAEAPWGTYLYVVAPIFDDGEAVGAVMVGESLARLVQDARRGTQDHIIVYNQAGQPLVATLGIDAAATALSLTDTRNLLLGDTPTVLMRDLPVEPPIFREVVAPLRIRGGETIALVGTAQNQGILATLLTNSRLEILLLFGAGFILVIAAGTLLARHIAQPVQALVQSALAVGEGNFGVRSDTGGGDEIGRLGHAFNRMVAGLRETLVYRDLVERPLTPAVRQQLRTTLQGRDLALDNYQGVTTALIVHFQNFDEALAVKEAGAGLDWLSDYMAAILPVVSEHDGTISSVQGDRLTAYFGLLPRPHSPADGAYQACRAALAMQSAVAEVNARRAAASETPLLMGIGVNTGNVTAGAIRHDDRLHFTVLGDTVATAERLETVTRQFETGGVVITHYTYLALGAFREAFHLEQLGMYALKDRRLVVYRLAPLPDADPDAPPAEVAWAPDLPEIPGPVTAGNGETEEVTEIAAAADDDDAGKPVDTSPEAESQAADDQSE